MKTFSIQMREKEKRPWPIYPLLIPQGSSAAGRDGVPQTAPEHRGHKLPVLPARAAPGRAAPGRAEREDAAGEGS